MQNKARLGGINFVAVWVMGASLYVALGKTGLLFATLNPASSPVWPAAGFAIAFLFFAGRRAWSAVFCGAFLVNLNTDLGISFAGMTALGNTLGALLGATLLGAGRCDINRAGKTSRLFFAATLPALLTATVGNAALALVPLVNPREALAALPEAAVRFFAEAHASEKVIESVATWAMGDTIGILLVVPGVLSFMRTRSERVAGTVVSTPSWAVSKATAWARDALHTGGYRTPCFLISLLVVALTLVALAKRESPSLLFGAIPLLLFIRVAGQGTLLLFAAVLSLGALALTLAGFGPFSGETLNHRVLCLQIYLVCVNAVAIHFSNIPLSLLFGRANRVRIIAFILLAWSFASLALTLVEREQTHRRNSLVELWSREMIRTVELRAENAVSLLRMSARTALQNSPEATAESLTKAYVTLLSEGAEDVRSQAFFLVPARGGQWRPVEGSAAPLERAALESALAGLATNTWRCPVPEPLRAQGAVRIRFALGSQGEARALLMAPHCDAAQSGRNAPSALLAAWLPVNSFFKVVGGASLEESVHFSFSHPRIPFTASSETDSQNEKADLTTTRAPPVPFLRKSRASLFGETFELMTWPRQKSFLASDESLHAALALVTSLVVLLLLQLPMKSEAFGKASAELAALRLGEIEKQKEALFSASKMSSLGEMAIGITSGMAHKKEIGLRIAGIARSLRAFAQDASQEPFTQVPCENLAAAAQNLCGERFCHHGISLTIISLTKGSGSRSTLRCRETQIVQVLMTLLGNAFDAVVECPTPYVKLTIEEGAPGFIEFRVEDNGHGIEASTFDRMMDPFFTTKGVGKGTGLGLSLSRGILEAHGGSLHCEQPAGPTVFVARLPKAGHPA